MSLEGDVDLLLTQQWPGGIARGRPAASLPAGRAAALTRAAEELTHTQVYTNFLKSNPLRQYVNFHDAGIGRPDAACKRTKM